MKPELFYPVALLLSFLTEAFVEYFVGIPVDKIPRAKPYKWLLTYVAAAVSIGLAFNYNLDLVNSVIEVLSGETAGPTTVGIVLTGLALGRGSNWLNDIWQRFLLTKK